MKIIKQEIASMVRVDVIIEIEENCITGDYYADENDFYWVVVSSENNISTLRNMNTLTKSYKHPNSFENINSKFYGEPSIKNK